MYNIVNELVIIFFFLSIGSFITMISYRIIDNNFSLIDFIFSRSKCVKCHNKLKIRNLIPIFSIILQKFKCSFCKSKISIRYPLIELLTAVILYIFYKLYNYDPLSIEFLLFILIYSTLIIAIITDIENYVIPNILQITLLILALIYNIFYYHDIIYYILSAIIFLSIILLIHYIFYFITKKQGIGIDDIKFFFIAGLFVGIKYFAIFIILSATINIIFSIIWFKCLAKIIIDKKELIGKEVPFAPSLALSLMIVIYLSHYEIYIF